MFNGTFLRSAFNCRPLISGLRSLTTYTAHPASVLETALESAAAEQGLILQFLSSTWVKKVTQPQV